MDKLVDRWPTLASELRAALVAEGEAALDDGVGDLVVVQMCGCGDDFCQSFYTAAPPEGAWGVGHRNVMLDPPWPGYLILDVVDEATTYVEVLFRPTPLD
jgi:hypothetical protein